MSKIKLPQKDYQELLKAERQLHDLLPELDAAEECGVECQQFRAMLADAQQRIAAIKKHFGPQPG